MPPGGSASLSSATAAPAAGNRKRWSRLAADIAQPVGALVGFVVLWELVCRGFGIPAYLAPAPSAIWTDTAKLAGPVAMHTLATTQTVLLGFAASVVISLPLAVLITSSRFIANAIYPLLVLTQSIPKVALAPILVMWLGYGILPKVMVAFLISFFPIVIAAVVGMRSAEKEMIYLVQSMGANELTTFLKIRLPRALPSIFGGLKVGMGQAVVGATVGEFIAAEHGLGYLQLISQVRLDTALLFAAVVVLSLLGVLLFNIVAWVERLALPWNRLRTEMIE